MELNHIYIDKFNNNYFVKGDVGDRPAAIVKYNEKLNRWMYEMQTSHKISAKYDKELAEDLLNQHFPREQNK